MSSLSVRHHRLCAQGTDEERNRRDKLPEPSKHPRIDLFRLVLTHASQTQLRTDIQQYLQMYRPEAASVAEQFPIVVVANGQNNQVLTPDAIEAQLDIEGDLDGELAIGISYPTKFMSWVTGGLNPVFVPDLFTPTDTDEPYNTWLDYVLSQDELPQVISSE
jgi:tripeptidyl-peptidase I